GRIALDSTAKTLDEGVDAANRHEGIAAPDLAEERLAAEHDPDMGRQQMQEPEFLIGQLDATPLDADATLRHIDLDAVDFDDPVSSRRGRLRHRATRAPEECPSPGHQFPDTEWFGEIVVGSAFEPHDLVGLFAAGGEHQNRHVPVQLTVAHGPAQ